MTLDPTDDAADDPLGTPAIDAATLALAPPDLLAPGGILRVSTDAAGGEADGGSLDPAVSANGRYVAFDSRASNLVPGAGGGTEDVFVKDLRTGAVALASADEDGSPGSGARSLYPAISAAGRFVAFDRLPSPAQPGGADARTDVLVRDLRTGRLLLASADADGTPGNGSSFGRPSISANGRLVAFASDASNLVPGDANGTADVFVKDLRTGAVTLASADAAGNGGNGFSTQPALSADGQHVAFGGRATNLVPGDTRGVEQIFVKDLRTGTVAAASADAAGNEGDDNSLNAAISADGRFVAFASFASDLAPGGGANGTEQVLVKDMQTGAVVLASAAADGTAADGISGAPAISPDGRYVAFESAAANLVPGAGGGHADVFLKDLWTGEVGLVAANPPPGPRQGISFDASAVTNAGTVAFASRSADLVPGDTNGAYDVFLSG